jgi:hypothetical protein
MEKQKSKVFKYLMRLLLKKKKTLKFSKPEMKGEHTYMLK